MCKLNKNLNKTLNNMGLSSKIPLVAKLSYCAHLIPSLIRDGHCISLGGAGIGKTTTIKNSSNKFKNISKVTSPSLFGNLNSKTPGLISNLYDVVAVEQISSIKSLDDDLINDLLTHCNEDEVTRLDETYENRTSLVFLGNCDTKYSIQSCCEDKSLPHEINTEFFNILPDDFGKEQGLERFIFLPSFHLRKIKTSSIIKIDDNSFKESVSENRMNFNNYNIEEMSMRAYKAHCKIITTLNYFINNNSGLHESTWIFKGFKAFASSLVQMSTEQKYTHFYYKNEDGRKLALALLLDLFDEDDVIEEAHFLENRALIKLKEKNFWYKVALNYIGEYENKIEYEFYNSNPENFISKIIEIKDKDMILVQEYVPLESDYFKVKNLDFLYNNKESEIDSLKKLLREQNEILYTQLKENIVLKRHLHDLTSALNHISMGGFTGIESPFREEYEMLIKKEKNLKDFHKILANCPKFEKKEIKNKHFGFKDEKFWLVNFADLIK
ncbi:MAG: BREX system Lon protease-like protein BrxL [Cetobacterium sp.]|uniref:BREX system Lon protease-like protein BrxL n=1 Tax=Cetobacterium sp. TaxID=2071632 RepID=UPI003F390FFB